MRKIFQPFHIYSSLFCCFFTVCKFRQMKKLRSKSYNNELKYQGLIMRSFLSRNWISANGETFKLTFQFENSPLFEKHWENGLERTKKMRFLNIQFHASNVFIFYLFFAFCNFFSPTFPYLKKGILNFHSKTTSLWNGVFSGVWHFCVTVLNLSYSRK